MFNVSDCDVVITRSGEPSLSRSPVVIAPGRSAVGKSSRGWNVPLPLPRKRLTMSRKSLVTTMSSLLSPSKSSTTSERRLVGARNSWRFGNVPSPVPSRTLTLESKIPLATARSILPSPFRSSITKAIGNSPVTKSSPVWKVPSPSPSRMVTVSESLLAIPTSGAPSLSRSPIDTATGLSPHAYACAA